MNLLINKARRGDKEAFVDLMKVNELALYKVAKSILKNDADVEDAMQETILTALEKITSLKEERYFKTWLTKILINKCNDILRKNKITVQMEEFYDAGYTENFIDHISMKEGLKILTQEQQLVLDLYYVMEFNARGISEMLSEKESTIKVRLFRSRNKLKNFFIDNKEREIING